MRESEVKSEIPVPSSTVSFNRRVRPPTAVPEFTGAREMKNTGFSRFALLLFAGLLLFAETHATGAQQANKKTAELGKNTPESLGFSS